MKDFFSKMDRKFLITAGLLITIPLFIIIVLMIVRGCSSGTGYENYQDKMIKKAEKYVENHQLLPRKSGKEVVVTLDELVDNGLKSPEKALKDSTCTGSVTVKRNNKEYMYIPYLECSEYTTDYIMDHLKKDVVKAESGLYKEGNEYIYKGNKVKNYVSFFGTIYRIIKIDSNNNLRMIKEKREDNQVSWDDKYNVSADDNLGINEYYNSAIYDQLWKQYNNERIVSKDMKKHMVGHSVCLDKKSNEDNNPESPVCQNVLNDQFISLPTIYDYTLASYDNDCKQIGDGACANFNYLDDVLTSTWSVNASSEDTYSVYYLAGSYIDTSQADSYKSYYWIISISGNELYTSGNGTETNPYIIK